MERDGSEQSAVMTDLEFHLVKVVNETLESD